jgi:mannose/cellobiose epimerase-like protein (N-acyl-D-glucosamine 2-epimerase family)
LLINPGSPQRAIRDASTPLIDFAKASAVPRGFGFLDRFGAVEKNRPPECFITARMTYCFSIAALAGVPGVERFAVHGVASLYGTFRDETFGGCAGALGGTPSSQRKRAYDTCFVALAASSAATAGIAGADDLTTDVADLLETRFWSADAGALVESWDREFAEPEPYWGANANMHGLEAMLALYGYSRNTAWRDYGLRIAETFINRHARAAKWWLNEHYGPDWTPLPDFNADTPRHEFRPYGMTPGHLFEWSRLLLQLESTFDLPPVWLREAAAGLYETAVDHGWAIDGKKGFVYTVDWNGRPVISDRPHWVTAEALSAAATWSHHTGDARYAAQFEEWADYAQAHFIDTVHGSWHHLLDQDNRPSYAIWSGKPDIYHALQATLVPLLPVAESTARAIVTADIGQRQSRAPEPPAKH